MTAENNITFDMPGCARCHGEGHKALTFKPFTFPVEEEDGTLLTHFAICPTTNEPILMGFVEKTDG